jgi:hypothetical protein
MASGVPVAAYPVDGPMQVLGQSQAGAMREDLREAWVEALKVKRHEARDRALHFGWGRASALFLSHLVVLPRHPRQPVPGLVRAGSRRGIARETVTQTSSAR